MKTNKKQIYEKFKRKRRKKIKKKDISKRFKIRPQVKRGIWMLKYRGRVFKNPNKNALLNDVAIINNYEVENNKR